MTPLDSSWISWKEVERKSDGEIAVDSRGPRWRDSCNSGEIAMPVDAMNSREITMNNGER
jgi:hypothetical protein